MRIIGGKWKGRRLAEIGAGDAAAHLRPSSDRTREMIFNMLTHPRFGDIVNGAQVLDIFAGTGAYGFEALSRGATGLIAIDNGKIAQSLFRDNQKRLGAKAELIAADARHLPPAAGRAAKLVFLDPPYGKGLGEQAMGSAMQQGWIGEGAIIIWEDALAPIAPVGFTLIDQRKSGRALISIYQNLSMGRASA